MEFSKLTSIAVLICALSCCWRFVDCQHHSRIGNPCSTECATCQEGLSGICTSCKPPFYLDGTACTLCLHKYKLKPKEALRLHHSHSPLEGVVQILFAGHWRYLATYDWEYKKSLHVCRFLGLGDIENFSRVSFVGSNIPYLNCRYRTLATNCHISTVNHDTRASVNTYGLYVRCSGPDSSRRCVWTCPDGYMLSSDFSECLPCDFSCQTCSRTPDECTSCSQSTYIPLYLQDGRCVSECSVGYYRVGQECHPCHRTCERCTGPLRTNCTFCPAGEFQSDGTCTKSCFSNHLLRPLPRNIRLVGGSSPFSGRLEVRDPNSGQWGTVNFINESKAISAKVACHALGYGPPVLVTTQYSVGANSFSKIEGNHSPILLYGVRCAGTENTLYECLRSVPRERPLLFDHRNDVGLVCSSETRPTVMTCPSLCNGADGYRVVIDLPRLCEKCGDGCRRCDASGCLQCYPGYFPTYAFPGGCTTTCAVGHYADTIKNRCLPCSHKCDGCLDGNRNDTCFECSRAGLVKYFHSGTDCVEECPSTLQQLRLPVKLAKNFDDYVNTPKFSYFTPTTGGGLAALCWSPDVFSTTLQVLRRQESKESPERVWEVELQIYNGALHGYSRQCKGYEENTGECPWKLERHCNIHMTLRLSKDIDVSKVKTCKAVNKEECRPGLCSRYSSCISFKRLPAYKSICWGCYVGFFGDGSSCFRHSSTPHHLLRKPRNAIVLLGSAGFTMYCQANISTSIAWYHQHRTGMYRLERTGRLFGEVIVGEYSIITSSPRTNMTGVYHCVSRTTYQEVKSSAYISVRNPDCNPTCPVNVTCGVYSEFGEETDRCCPSCRVPMSSCPGVKCFPVRNCARYANKTRPYECCLSCLEKAYGQPDGTCSHVVCPTGSVCRGYGEDAVCVCRTCPSVPYKRRHVNGWDGNVYASKCHLQREACRYRVYLGQAESHDIDDLYLA